MKKAGIVLCIVFLVGILLISSASASLLSELWHKLSGKDASLTGFQTKASGSSAPLKKEICNNFDDHGVPKDDNGNRLANCEDSVPCPKGTPCDENDPAKKCLEDKTCGLSREDAAKCDDTDGGKKPDKFGEIFINNNPNSVAFDICVNKDGSVGQDGAVKYVKEFFCKSPDKSKYLFQIMKCKGKWLCSEGKCAYFKMQETEANCSDGFDNDEDSSVDCADSDCEGQTCSEGGICIAQKCEFTPPPEKKTEICDNYDSQGKPIDDDGDGLANCDDTEDCDGKICKHSPDLYCKNKKCEGKIEKTQSCCFCLYNSEPQKDAVRFRDECNDFFANPTNYFDEPGFKCDYKAPFIDTKDLSQVGLESLLEKQLVANKCNKAKVYNVEHGPICDKYFYIAEMCVGACKACDVRNIDIGSCSCQTFWNTPNVDRKVGELQKQLGPGTKLRMCGNIGDGLSWMTWRTSIDANGNQEVFDTQFYSTCVSSKIFEITPGEKIIKFGNCLAEGTKCSPADQEAKPCRDSVNNKLATTRCCPKGSTLAEISKPEAMNKGKVSAIDAKSCPMQECFLTIQGGCQINGKKENDECKYEKARDGTNCEIKSYAPQAGGRVEEFLRFTGKCKDGMCVEGDCPKVKENGCSYDGNLDDYGNCKYKIKPYGTKCPTFKSDAEDKFCNGDGTCSISCGKDNLCKKNPILKIESDGWHCEYNTFKEQCLNTQTQRGWCNKLGRCNLICGKERNCKNNPFLKIDKENEDLSVNWGCGYQGNVSAGTACNDANVEGGSKDGRCGTWPWHDRDYICCPNRLTINIVDASGKPTGKSDRKLSLTNGECKYNEPVNPQS